VTVDRMLRPGRVSRSRLYCFNNSDPDRAVDVGFCGRVSVLQPLEREYTFA
jgi:hypothetical protein